MGLSNIKKNTDEMILTSESGRGTHLEFIIYLDEQTEVVREDRKKGLIL